MNLSLGLYGWSIVLVSIVAAIIAGKRARDKQSTTDDKTGVSYMLAGRTLTAPLFAVTLVATWYGSVLASGEFIVRNGLMFFLCFGVPYYGAAVLYALFLSKRIRQSEVVSIPSTISRVFGTRAGLAAAFAILFIAIPAPFMLSLGVLLQSLTHLPLWLCIIIGTACSLVIVAKGGLRSDVAANVVQLTLMFGGFVILACACVAVYGGFPTMVEALPSASLSVPGAIGWSGVAVWMLIALQTVVDPNFHMRTAAATSPVAARNGLLISVVGWVFFDVLQLTIGLYGVAYVSTSNPQWHFLTVAQATLPDALKGVFVAGVLAAIMSTLDGYALSSATTIGHDLWGASRGHGSMRYRLYGGLIITGVGGALAAIAIPSIVDLIVAAASITVPGLMVPLIASLWKPIRLLMPTKWGLPPWLLIVIPCAVAALTTVYNINIAYVIEPMFCGLFCSFALLPLTRRADVTI